MDAKLEMPARYRLVTGSLLVALAVVACDRRDVQPRQESEATDSVILDPAATGPGATVDPLPPPATSACAGLSGEDEAECRARESARRAGESPPAGDAEHGDRRR